MNLQGTQIRKGWIRRPDESSLPSILLSTRECPALRSTSQYSWLPAKIGTYHDRLRSAPYLTKGGVDWAILGFYYNLTELSLRIFTDLRRCVVHCRMTVFPRCDFLVVSSADRPAGLFRRFRRDDIVHP